MPARHEPEVVLMPISVTCDCGKILKVKEELAGRKGRCPACQAVLTIPRPDSEDEMMQMLLGDSSESDERLTTAGSASSSPVEADEGMTTRPPAPQADRPSRTRRDEADVPRLPRRKELIKRQPARRSGVAFEEGWFGSLNAGVIGGLLMMLIAVVWFVVGLMGNIIFFYPPILFVIGLGAIFRGLSNRG
jgi:hypothetical protein